MAKQTKKHSLGFGGTYEVSDAEEKKPIDAKAVNKAGLIPELVVRFPIIVELQKLELEDLKRILVGPKNSITKQYQNLMDIDGISLEFTDEALDYIAEKAYKNNTVARGLKAIIEKNMTEFMFEAPNKNINSVKTSVKDGKLQSRTRKEKVA